MLTLKGRVCYSRDTMSYILKYNGDTHPDTDDVKKVLRANNVTILDSSALPKMLLVDGIKANHLSKMKLALHEWEFFPQQNCFKIPDTRPKVK
jgi:hypothetical protein